MKSKVILICGLTLACIGAYAPAASAAGETGILLAQAPSDPNYRVGDTLPSTKRAAASGYEDLLWSTLLPEGWSVEKMMESLNLADLQDNDPKAKETLQKIQEMWDNAPVNTKLDNKRVRIPGFVVPLDGERDKAKEFLLVPYFGACIHAPAPPANQVIHVVVNKSVGAVKLFPAAWISGTIRTARSDTRMGVSGYEFTVDKVEPY
jgi:hypothetical protein